MIDLRHHPFRIIVRYEYICVYWKTMAFDGGETFKTRGAPFQRGGESGLGQRCFDPFLFSWLIGAESRLTRYPETRTWTAHDRQDIAGLVLFGATGIDCTTRKCAPKIAFLSARPKFCRNFSLHVFLLFGKINKSRDACARRIKK